MILPRLQSQHGWVLGDGQTFSNENQSGLTESWEYWHMVGKVLVSVVSHSQKLILLDTYSEPLHKEN